jgi:nitrogen regulatory protein PII-like uncharacterized protein
MILILGKKTIVTIGIVAALSIPATVFAATSDSAAAKAVRGFFGIDTSKMTTQQKADFEDYSKKLAQVQKDYINKAVANGTVTKEQGDAAIKKIDDAVANGTYGKNMFGDKGGEFGDREGKNLFGINLSKLTDAQKAVILDSVKSMASLQKDLITKLVSANVITKDQGDKVAAAIDAAIANGNLNIERNFMGLGFGKIDYSKLTADQKAILADYSKKMADVAKDLVSKMVANSSITKDQGDKATSLIDNMIQRVQNGDLQKGMMGKHRGFGGQKGMMQKPSNGTGTGTGTSTTSTAPAM